VIEGKANGASLEEKRGGEFFAILDKQGGAVEKEGWIGSSAGKALQQGSGECLFFGKNRTRPVALRSLFMSGVKRREYRLLDQGSVVNKFVYINCIRGGSLSRW